MQEFEARSNGLRRVDVLGATFARRNEGALELTLVAGADGSVVATRRVPAADMRDLDWLPLDFAPRADSTGQRFRLEIRGLGGPPGAAATVMATAAHDRGGLPRATLALDGVPDSRSLWVRTFAPPPDRVPGATPVYARDLNVYVNPMTRPAAWFVADARVVAPDDALAAVESREFDPGRVAIVEQHVEGAAGGASARVVRVAAPDPDTRLIEVEAPAGGVLVLRERFHRGWSLRAGSDPIPLFRADSVLMAASIPPGTRHLELAFATPAFGPSLLLSGLALAGTVLALFRRR